jgi:hemerythrin
VYIHESGPTRLGICFPHSRIINNFTGGYVMALVQWSDKFSVGIPSIDAQHQKLFSLLNDLYDAMQRGHSKDILGKILSELISYTANHFATEEKLFTQHAYPDRVAHKKEHDALVQKALKIKADFESGKTGVSMELLSFLKDWVQNHIQGTDKQYGPFLAGKGVR